MSTFLLCLISLITLQEPPAGQPPPPPPGQGNTGTIPPNQPGFGSNVLVDGTYVVLAYDKFGQSLPGMTNVRVVIRGNILIFPGDAKLPGKMLQLAFGPNNTIMVTPIEGIRKDANNNSASHSASPWPEPSKDPNGVTQTGGIMNATSEMGVYILSNEYFSISIAGRQTTPPAPPGSVPPGGTPPIGILPGGTPPGSMPPGTIPPQVPPTKFPDRVTGNTVGNVPANSNNPSFPIQGGNTPPPGNGVRPAPGTGSYQAVLVLKRVTQ